MIRNCRVADRSCVSSGTGVWSSLARVQTSALGGLAWKNILRVIRQACSTAHESQEKSLFPCCGRSHVEWKIRWGEEITNSFCRIAQTTKLSDQILTCNQSAREGDQFARYTYRRLSASICEATSETSPRKQRRAASPPASFGIDSSKL